MSNCWLWKGSRSNDGYGLGSLPMRPRGAHRMVYEFLVGKIPEGMQLDHLCRNTGCVNPAHLEPVSQRENILRSEAEAAKRARWDRCPRGHSLAWAAWPGRNGRPRRLCQACKKETRRRYNERQKEKAA